MVWKGPKWAESRLAEKVNPAEKLTQSNDFVVEVEEMMVLDGSVGIMQLIRAKQ